MVFHFIPAEAEDFNDLTNLCIDIAKKKGIPEDQLILQQEKFSITPRYIRQNKTYKILDIDGKIIGFGSLHKLEEEKINEISNFVILPEYRHHPMSGFFLKYLEKKVSVNTFIKVCTDVKFLEFFRNYGYENSHQPEGQPESAEVIMMKKIVE